jgi:hypothetical protein
MLHVKPPGNVLLLKQIIFSFFISFKTDYFFFFLFFSRPLRIRIEKFIWIRNTGSLICYFCVKVPGVDVVLQQEADLRKLQQQFRPVPQQQRLAPWEQPRLLQEQQSSQELAPWEVAEQRRVQQEQLRLQQEEQQRLQAMS